MEKYTDSNKNDVIINLCGEVEKYIGLIQSVKLKFTGFHEELDNNPEYHKFGDGIKYVSITKRRNELIILRGKALSDELSRSDLKLFNKYERKIRNFLAAAQKYLSDLEKDQFTAKSWFIYFLYVTKDSEPKLGRTVLKIQKKNTVKFKNVKDGLSPDYIGNYKYLYNKVIFFDLDNKNKDRKLHIKVACRNPDDEILLGSYITFELDHIVSGSTVFHAISNKTKKKEIYPAILPDDDPELYKKVPPSIKQYLSIRNLNYYKVPKHIPHLKRLTHFLEKYSHEKHMKERFLERQKPIVFIAAQGVSVNPNKFNENAIVVKNIRDKLDKRFPSLDIRFTATKTIDESPKKTTTHANLELLKRTRFFVLILSEIGKASFSLVQLGWALAYCKSVLVFYKEGTISKRFLSLDIGEVTVKSFKNLEEDAFSVIYKELEQRIKVNLP